MDDMFNVSGHLLSTAEIESALIEHSKIAEAAAVAFPHKTKGECCYCFVTLIEVGELNIKLLKIVWATVLNLYATLRMDVM